MEKLTIKELAPYLPYGLNVVNENGIGYCEINNIQIAHIIEYDRISEVKPILRPLSDLDDGYDNTPESLQECTYSYIQILLSNHYDIFGLIEKGLAIDINTLENGR